LLSGVSSTTATRSELINLSVVFAGQSVGIKQVSDEIWLVSFMDYESLAAAPRPARRNDSEAARSRAPYSAAAGGRLRYGPIADRGRKKCYLCPRYDP
jgi:hypothetical protein